MIGGRLPVAFPLEHALADADLILAAARRDEDMGMVIEASRARRPAQPVSRDASPR